MDECNLLCRSGLVSCSDASGNKNCSPIYIPENNFVNCIYIGCNAGNIVLVGSSDKLIPASICIYRINLYRVDISIQRLKGGNNYAR